jgi:hypothetical protein
MPKGLKCSSLLSNDQFINFSNKGKINRCSRKIKLLFKQAPLVLFDAGSALVNGALAKIKRCLQLGRHKHAAGGTTHETTISASFLARIVCLVWVCWDSCCCCCCCWILFAAAEASFGRFNERRRRRRRRKGMSLFLAGFVWAFL